MTNHDGRPATAPRRRRLAALAALAALTVVAGCGGDPGGASGRLQILVAGLPTGTDADIGVTGPGGFAESVTGGVELTQLVAGSYTVTANPVAGYDPTPASQTADVTAGTRTTVTVAYQLASSSHPGCTPYGPTALSRAIDGAWQTVGEEKDETFSTPSDPGGGYVALTLETDAPAVPWLNVTVDPSASGAITSGSAATQENEQLRSVAFEAAASRTYHAFWYEFIAAPQDQHPWPYRGSWTFHSRVDCFEPNDTQGTAAEIAFDVPIEAFVIAGYRETNAISISQDAWDDWYTFSLAAPSRVRIDLQAVPSNVRMRVNLLNEAGTLVLDDETAAAAGELLKVDLLGGSELSAGTYGLRVYPATDVPRRVDPAAGDSIPDHFDVPYELVVSLPDAGEPILD